MNMMMMMMMINYIVCVSRTNINHCPTPLLLQIRINFLLQVLVK